MKAYIIPAVVIALALTAASAHAQTPALDANTRAMAAAVKAGDRNKIADLQHQRQALMLAQEKLNKAATTTNRYAPQ